MDLGGVDVAGARREPVEGEPTYGLYEHKRSFGARWVALAGAQERVERPWRYALGRGVAKLARTAGQGTRRDERADEGAHARGDADRRRPSPSTRSPSAGCLRASITRRCCVARAGTVSRSERAAWPTLPCAAWPRTLERSATASCSSRCPGSTSTVTTTSRARPRPAPQPRSSSTRSPARPSRRWSWTPPGRPSRSPPAGGTAIRPRASASWGSPARTARRRPRSSRSRRSRRPGSGPASSGRWRRRSATCGSATRPT